MNESVEIQYLLREVERTYGSAVRTSCDFEHLSQDIDDVVGVLLSVSTLKRLWGYVSLHPRPRVGTLDILSRYAGRECFRDVCRELQDSSDFFSAETVVSKNLERGTKVKVGWYPDRKVELEYLGDDRYLVLDGGTSKLMAGDEFDTSEFIKGQPLFVGGIIRNGGTLPPYVSGKAFGISTLEITQS